MKTENGKWQECRARLSEIMPAIAAYYTSGKQRAEPGSASARSFIFKESDTMSKRSLSILSIALSGILVTGCSMAGPPPGLDLRLSHPSERMTYVVTMRPIEEPVAIDRLHAWEISLTSAAGVPVTHARIGFDGGMPQHGHGFPTSPRVTGELGDGRYRLDGMKFSMSGWWEMKLTIDSAIGLDKATFNTVIGTPVARVAPVAQVAPMAPVAAAVASVR
jgi:hypothetical protein